MSMCKKITLTLDPSGADRLVLSSSLVAILMDIEIENNIEHLRWITMRNFEILVKIC